MKQQTAVEFLVERLAENGILHSSDIAEAKEIEKRNVCEAYVYGAAYGIDVANNIKPDIYYRETFESNEQE
jgi:hypothetical protein